MVGAVSHGAAGRTPRAEVDGPAAREIAETMQALATPSRVRILARLRDGAAGVSELAAAVDMDASAVSHQLRVLRHLGLVVGKRTGRTVVYSLHDSHVADLLDQALWHVEHLRLRLRDSAEAAS